MTELTGRTVLVTGANRGLGREFVQQLMGRGVAKVYAAARNPATITDDDPRGPAAARRHRPRLRRPGRRGRS